MGQPSSAPGWYPDPSGAPGKRYFDGVQWTGAIAAAPPTTSPGISRTQKWWFLGLAIAGTLTIGLLAALGKDVGKDIPPDGHTPGTGSGYAAPGSPAEAPTAGLNQPVRDGKFEFVVMAVNSDGGGYMTVHMKVANIGNEAQTFFAQNQKLIDTAGRTYEPDTMMVYKYNQSAMVELNPGLNTTSIVPFHVAEGTQIAAVEVHDSAFSGGARIKVG
jgi:hypothetical protein